MADTVTSSSYVSIKFPIIRNGEEAVRIISVPEAKSSIQDLKTGKSDFLNAIRTAIGIDYLIQPTNWRDTDETEEAWVLDTNRQPEFEVKTSTSTILE